MRPQDLERVAGEDSQDCRARVGSARNGGVGDGVPGLGPGARQLRSASVHPRPDVSRGEGQRGPRVDHAGDSFGWCVCQQRLEGWSSSSKCLLGLAIGSVVQQCSGFSYSTLEGLGSAALELFAASQGCASAQFVGP